MAFQAKSSRGPATFGQVLKLSNEQKTTTYDGVKSTQTRGFDRGVVLKDSTQPWQPSGDLLPKRVPEELPSVAPLTVQWGCAVGAEAVYTLRHTEYYYTPEAFKVFGADAPFRPRDLPSAGYWASFNLLTLVDVRITPFVSVPLWDILTIDPNTDLDPVVWGDFPLAFAYAASTEDHSLPPTWSKLLPITVSLFPTESQQVKGRWDRTAAEPRLPQRYSFFRNSEDAERSQTFRSGRLHTLRELLSSQEKIYAVWSMRDQIISTLLTKFFNQISGAEPPSSARTERASVDQNIGGLTRWLRDHSDSLDPVSVGLIRSSISSIWGEMFAGGPQADARTDSCVYSETRTRSGGRTRFPAGDLLVAASLKAVGAQVMRQADVQPGMTPSNYGSLWVMGGGISELVPQAPKNLGSGAKSLGRVAKVWGLYKNLRQALRFPKVRAAIGTGKLLASVFEVALPENAKISVANFLASRSLTSSAHLGAELRVKGITPQSEPADVESFLTALLILDLGCLDGSPNQLRVAIGQFSQWVPKRSNAVRRGEASAWSGIPFQDLFGGQFNYVSILPNFHNILSSREGPYRDWSEGIPYVPIDGGVRPIFPIDGGGSGGRDPDIEVLAPFPREVIEQVSREPLFKMVADYVGVNLSAQVDVLTGNAHKWGVPPQGVMAYLILASHYNTMPIADVNSLFAAGFQPTLSADESLQQSFQRISGALQQYQEGVLSDTQLLSQFNQRGLLQTGKQTGEGLSTTTKVILGVGAVGALYVIYNRYLKDEV